MHINRTLLRVLGIVFIIYLAGLTSAAAFVAGLSAANASISTSEALLGLIPIALIGTLQFLPGFGASLYWPDANRKGLLCGLAAGLGVWLFTLLLPALSSFEPLFQGYSPPDLLPGDKESFRLLATLASLALNAALLFAVSRLTSRGELATPEAHRDGDPGKHTAQAFTPPGSIEGINLIERNLDKAQINFTGLAADLDNLRRHYRETLDKLPIGVCSIGSDGKLLMWNRSMEQTTGISAEDVLGSLLDSLGEPWREVIGDFVLGNVATVLKKEVPIEHSSSRWISLHKASIDDSTRNSNDRIILVEDITDYELMEQELLHNERLASIGQLAAGVAHEIGNPITGIACLAQNLEFETDANEIRDTASEILKQTDRVTRIVESLVNFSHVGSRTGDVKLTPSNLADCVDEAVHLLQLDHEAKVVSFDNLNDRELVVLADSQRLLQVFVNLLGNARDACEPGGTIQVDAVRSGERVTINIEDNGCGIPPEQQSQVFDPFYTTKDPGEGTGLGLALVYTIMEDMGGSVQLESPIGSDANPGTRFTLELPLGRYGSEFEV